MSTNGGGLTALVVDDELPALSDLGYLLGRDDRVEEVITASSGTEALQVLDVRDVDVVFSDISMPGLDGMALARVISRFSVRPQIVFVTAHDEHAVDAFAVAATDYVMKPVRADRLSEAIRRVVAAQSERGAGMPSAASEPAARSSRTRPSRSSSAGSPASSTAARSATRRPTATTPASTRPPARTSCACRSACSRSGGPSSASSGSTAAPSSPSPTSARCGWTTAGARSSSATSSCR